MNNLFKNSIIVLAALSLSAIFLVSGAPAQTQFSFQQAYDSASAGAVVKVPAGQVVVDWAAAGAATISNGTKQITFECLSDTGLVTFEPGAPNLMFRNVSNVTLRGKCFRFRNLQIGVGGDSNLNVTNITIDGITNNGGSKFEGIDVSGAQNITIRNMQHGPTTICYAQGRTGVGDNGGPITSTMWCDPSIPQEADYVTVGNDATISGQAYFHNNSGGVLAKVIWENNRTVDIQTKDAFNEHTGCGLVWQSGGSGDMIVIRNSRFERCAVQGIQFSDVDNVRIEGNWFGPPMEPLSNGNINCPGQTLPCEAGNFAKEITCQGGGGQTCVNWVVRSNTLCHGTRGDGASGSNVLFEGNDLGREDAPWSFATYVGNTNVGASCSGTPPPPPNPACSNGTDDDADGKIDYPADTGCSSATDTDETDPIQPPPVDNPPVFTGNFVIKSSKRLTVTIGWDKATDDKGIKNYRLYRDGVFLATAGPLAVQAKFAVDPAKGFHVIRVEAVDTIDQRTARETAVEYKGGTSWVKHW